MQSLALSVRPDGSAWAVWGDTRAGATNQDIWGSQYDPALNTWSTPVRLDDAPGTTTSQLSPTVASAALETSLAWRDNRLSANGDIQARKLVFAIGAPDHFTLSYDGLNRLTAVTGPVPETFALDGPSNVLTRSGTAESYDQANRLTDDGAVHNVWSDADRLATRGADTFGYDALDRMTSSSVSGTARSYTYNGDGLLQTRTGGVSASFLWDPSTSVQRELKQSNDNIIYGLGPLYVVKADTTTLTFARDGSKSVRAELSSTGAVTAAFRYRAYGQTAQTTTAALATYLGFAGQMVDPSGLINMRARWYDPGTGRFLTKDSVNGDVAIPSQLNAYSYAAANPQRFADPSGMSATTGDTAGGDCERVSTCGSPIRQVLDAVLDERDAADAARQSSNPLIAATGWIEEGAAVVAGGALAVAGVAATASAGAYVVGEALPSYLVGNGLVQGVSFAGAGSVPFVALRIASDLAARYGGQAANWAHFASRGFIRVPFGGPTIQIHWLEEVVEGIIVNAKFKIQ